MPVNKTTAAGSNAPVPNGIRMPTPAEMTVALRSFAENAENTHHAKKISKAPAGIAKATEYNITMPRRHGLTKTAYIVNGDVYVKTQLLSPTAKPQWEKIKGQPMF
jgi:hypothetical protein